MLIRSILRIEEHAASILMGGLLLVLFLQVFTRYVVNDPFSWTEEAARYLYVYIVFLGASAAVSDRSHVAIGFLAAKLPLPLRFAVSLAINAAILFLLINLVYWGVQATLRQSTVEMMTIEISYAWVYAVVPATAVLMSLRTLVVMGEDWRDFRAGRTPEDRTSGAL